MVQDNTARESDGELLDVYKRHLNPNYADFAAQLGLATTIARAEGALLWDREGRSYIDFVAGYGVFNFGHNPPWLLDALHGELDQHPLWNRPFLSAPLAELAQALTRRVPRGLSRLFLCSSGAEAVESAIKLARLATRRQEIVSAEGSFHGFTLGALSVSGIPAQSRPFRPLLPQVRHVPYGDVEALSQAVTDQTAAVLLEPIQAEIGAATPPSGYLAAAREVCKSTGALLLVDEVRTGMGRTGPLFAVEAERITPDVLILGKSLAAGIVPIGAIVAQDDIWGRFGLSFSMTASSFAGNRLACVSALATLAAIDREAVLETSQRTADRLQTALARIAAQQPNAVKRLTGRGFLYGLHFADFRQAAQVVRQCIGQGLLIASAFCKKSCILLEPPLTIEPEQLTKGIQILERACHSLA